MWSLSDCIPWMTVGIVQSVAIVTLNLCTIIVFIRNRNLRKRSTYLVINLAVMDMFVGVVNVPYYLFYFTGMLCNLWKWRVDGAFSLVMILLWLFLSGSLINIAAIALERVHATFFPFRHRVLKERVYRLTIAVVWVTSVLIAVAYSLLLKFKTFHASYLRATFFFICLLVICVSYTCIVIKFRCGAQPQHHGAASRERKLTLTLLIVTVVSLLLYLPYTVLWLVISISKYEKWFSLPPSVGSHIYYALLVLFYANSLVNPILYAIRMPEFRSAFLALFRKSQQQRQDAVFPLRDM